MNVVKRGRVARRRTRQSSATETAPPRAPRVFVPHVAAGVSPFADLVPTPVLASSLNATIDAKINAFAAKNGNGKWKNLPRASVANRLKAVAKSPTLIDQDQINACGPAMAMYLFARERTEKFVECAINLYDNGKGAFGILPIFGTGLFDHDPVKWGINPDLLLDWMMLSSLRRSEDSASGATFKFDGSPDDGASGITWSSDMEKWLKHGVGFSKVTDETSYFTNESLSHLEKLDPTPDRIIVLLINVDVVTSGSKKGAKKDAKSKSAGIGERIMTSFPNHYCELEKKVSVGSDVIVWTWGQSGYKLAPFTKGDPWEDAYFGAFTCER